MKNPKQHRVTFVFLMPRPAWGCQVRGCCRDTQLCPGPPWVLAPTRTVWGSPSCACQIGCSCLGLFPGAGWHFHCLFIADRVCIGEGCAWAGGLIGNGDALVACQLPREKHGCSAPEGLGELGSAMGARPPRGLWCPQHLRGFRTPVAARLAVLLLSWWRGVRLGASACTPRASLSEGVRGLLASLCLLRFCF